MTKTIDIELPDMRGYGESDKPTYIDAYGGGFDQYEKSWYMLLFQFPDVAEQWLSENSWWSAQFRDSVLYHPSEWFALGATGRSRT